MEIIDPEQKKQYEERKYEQTVTHSEGHGRLIAGVLVIGAGLILLARKMGIYFPDWLFTWQMIVITIGVIIGVKENFRPGLWMIAIFVGVVFLIDRWIPDFNIRPYFWPIVIILIGVVMILSPARRRGFRSRRTRSNRFSNVNAGPATTEELLETVSIFGGVKKNVISKNFRGGEITCIFGGAEINLSQADIQGKAFLEVNQVFGGTTLIIPSNWQLQTESTAILGSVEDTRIGNKDNVDSGKTLVLEGTSVFGGISVKSY